MKNVKKLLLAVILIVAITHRHEDYCSNHPHGATGKQGSPYTFGPWMPPGKTQEVKNHLINNRDTLPVEKAK